MTSFQGIGTDISELLSDSFFNIYLFSWERWGLNLLLFLFPRKVTELKKFFSGSPELVIQEESHLKIYIKFTTQENKTCALLGIVEHRGTQFFLDQFLKIGFFIRGWKEEDCTEVWISITVSFLGKGIHMHCFPSPMQILHN